MRRTALLVACAILATLTTSSLAARADHIREGDVRFKVTCTFDHAAPDDPIVYPNKPGASHLHDFTGRRGITASTDTYRELQAGTTTCNDPGDKAGYWTPSMYVNGAKRDPVRMTAYYRRGEKHGDIRTYPTGLAIVAGHNPADMGTPTGETGWQCNGRQSPNPTPDGCTTDLTLRIAFPDCWDGKSRDSADHRSHMAYSAPSGDANVCPPTHPIPVSQLTTYTHYGDIPAGATVTLSSGDPEHGAHGDFLNGWDKARLLERIDTCLNQLQRCDSGG